MDLLPSKLSPAHEDGGQAIGNDARQVGRMAITVGRNAALGRRRVRWSVGRVVRGCRRDARRRQFRLAKPDGQRTATKPPTNPQAKPRRSATPDGQRDGRTRRSNGFFPL